MSTATTPASIHRPLGSTETIYWLLDKLYCLNFVVFAEIEGRLDATRLQDALATVQSENPLLRAHIVKTHGVYWFKSTSPHAPLLPETLPLKNWRQAVERELHTPFDTELAPLARFLWFKGTGKKCVVAMSFHHAIADGRSGTAVLLDVLRRATVDTSPAAHKCAHASSQDLDVIRQKAPLLGALQGVRFWLSKGKEALQFAQQLPAFDPTPLPTRDVRILPFAVEPPLLARLQAQARRHGTTVHGALGAALLLAIQDQFDHPVQRRLALNSLADLRGVLNGNLSDRDLGLYVTTLCTVHGVGPQTDFWSLAREIRDELQHTMDSGDGNLINGVYPPAPVWGPHTSIAKLVQGVVSLGPAASMLTNIGRIDTVDLGTDVRVSTLGFGVSPPAQHPICITAATYGGLMSLHLLHDALKVRPEQAAHIGSSLLAHLDGACRLDGN